MIQRHRYGGRGSHSTSHFTLAAKSKYSSLKYIYETLWAGKAKLGQLRLNWGAKAKQSNAPLYSPRYTSGTGGSIGRV